MSDLLVYVNETASCSVVIDNSDVTLHTFRQEILEVQVGDVLRFPFKFTRIVNNKRVVVGLKQESILKLRQCMEQSEELALYLIREEPIPTIVEEPNAQDVPSTSQDTRQDSEQIPPKKKARISRQPTLVEMYSPNRSTATSSPPQPYSAAKARNIKIFSAREIAESSGMTKTYREFWNNKAEELCCTNVLKSFKPGEIQGAINVAWTIKKTDLLKEQMEEVNKEIVSKCPVDLMKKFQLSKATLAKNTQRVETAATSLQDIQRELTSRRQDYFDSRSKTERKEASVKVEQLEKDLDSQLAELRKAQDALRKATDARRKLLEQQDLGQSELESTSSEREESGEESDASTEDD